MRTMNDQQLDQLLAALSKAGFGLPYSARIRDYMPDDRVYGVDSPEFAALKAADAEAWQKNRDALGAALHESGPGGPS